MHAIFFHIGHQAVCKVVTNRARAGNSSSTCGSASVLRKGCALIFFGSLQNFWQQRRRRMRSNVKTAGWHTNRLTRERRTIKKRRSAGIHANKCALDSFHPKQARPPASTRVGHSPPSDRRLGTLALLVLGLAARQTNESSN
jgi:hypothetical protein